MAPGQGKPLGMQTPGPGDLPRSDHADPFGELDDAALDNVLEPPPEEPPEEENEGPDAALESPGSGGLVEEPPPDDDFFEGTPTDALKGGDTQDPFTYEGEEEVALVSEQAAEEEEPPVLGSWFEETEGSAPRVITPGASSPMDRKNAIKAFADSVTLDEQSARAYMRGKNLSRVIGGMSRAYLGAHLAVAGSGARPEERSRIQKERPKGDGRKPEGWPPPMALGDAGGTMLEGGENLSGMEADPQARGSLPPRGNGPGILPEPPRVGLIASVMEVLPPMVKPGALAPPKQVKLALPILPPRPEPAQGVEGGEEEGPPREKTKLVGLFSPREREGAARSQSFVLLPEVRPPAPGGPPAGMADLFRAPAAKAPAPKAEPSASKGPEPEPREAEGPQPASEPVSAPGKPRAWSRWWLAVVGGIVGGLLVLAVVVPVLRKRPASAPSEDAPAERRAAKIRYLLQEQARVKAEVDGVEREIQTATKGIDMARWRALEQRRKRLQEASKVLDDQLAEVYQGKD